MWLENFFYSFESFWIFCRNLRHGSQISIYVSRVKIAEETVFLFFFSELFRILSEKFFRHLAKKLQKVFKTTFCVSRGTICGLIFFLKFWIVLDFLQKPLAWFSNVYLRVRSKNCGRKSFLIFLFRIFFGFWEENFPDFRPKNFIKFSKLPSTCPEEQFVAWNFFLKFWIVLDLLQKPSAWFSNFYLRVKSKNCGRNSFLIFLFTILFGFWEKNFPDFRPKNFIKFSKLPSTCPEEQFVTWIFFLKFWIVLDFLQKPSAWFSNFYLRVKSKNCGRNSFLIFLFRTFSDFEWKIFQTFGQKTS